MNHVPFSTPLANDAEKLNPRTEAALQRLRTAMRTIESEITQHQGIYPFNHGRVTQSELCRRADVKKATLQNPTHKDSTRVEIMAWLDELRHRLAQTRDATRERITATEEALAAEVHSLAQACNRLQAQLVDAEKLVSHLKAENSLLKASLQQSHAPKQV